MDFMKIISHAWNIVKKNRYLWWLGILAAGAEGVGSSFGSSGSNFSNIFNNQSNTIPPSNSSPTQIQGSVSEFIDKMPRVLGASTVKQTESFTSWMSNNWPYVVIIIGVLILLFVLIVYISNSARAGLILSVDHMESDKKKLNFGTAFSNGKKFAWRLFGLNFLIGLIIFGFLLIIASPLITSIITHAGITINILAAVFFFLGLLVLIVLSIYLGVALKFAARVLVFHDVKITEAFRRSRRLLHNQFKNSLFTWLINIAISTIFGIALGIGIVILLAILACIGFIFYAVAQTVGVIIYAIIIGLAFIILMYIISGIYTAFSSTYWTLSYRAIDYLEKKSRD